MRLSRCASRSGFGLPATILMLIVFAVLGLTGLSLARSELQSGVRATSREAAFYAAETGLLRGLQNWSKPFGVLPPGTSWTLDQATLPGGASYRVGATLVDDRGVHVLYSINSQGRARDGRTQRVNLLVATLTVDLPFQAALEVLDSVHLAGTADVDGFDRIPPDWNGPFCTVADDDKAGIMQEDITEFLKEGAADYDGDPPHDEFEDVSGFFDFTDFTFEELAAEASYTLTAGETVAGGIPAPVYNVDGTCDTSNQYNWGDPENPGQPCADWFPIIYAPGDLHLESNQEAQGLLLVDGNLSAKGGFTFYGPVVVRGELISEGNFTFYGGVKAQEVDLGAGKAQIYYSACVLERALSHTAAARPRALTQRPWFSER